MVDEMLTKFIDVPSNLSFHDKESLLNIHLRALQSNGYIIFSVRVVDDETFIVEYKKTD